MALKDPHSQKVARDRLLTEGGLPVERDRNGGAPMRQMKGFYEAPYDPIDYFKLSQNMRPEEAKREAQRLKREKTIIGPDGNQVSDDNPSARAKAFRDQVNGVAAPAGTPAAMRGRVNGAGQEGTLPNGNTPVAGDPFGTGHLPMGEDNPFAKSLEPFTPPNTPVPAASAAVQPVGPSTVRQPVGMVDPENTPAMRRQMAADAAMGRTVNTMGDTGIDKFAGTFPVQAPNYRRMISSKYGTGTNVARTADQGPATTTDLMGRTVPLGQFLADQKAVQKTKYGPDAEQAGEDYFKPATPADMRAKARRTA